MTEPKLEIKINRTNRAIYAQAVLCGKTTAGKLYRFKAKSGTPVEQAHRFGEDFAQKVLKETKKNEKIRFDRGKHIYHGRVAAFAEGLRQAGLKF